MAQSNSPDRFLRQPGALAARGPAQLPDYAELFCFSNFTFLQGASHAEELVARAAQLGYHALAITDECSVAGVVRAHVQAKEANFPLIIGSYFELTPRPGENDKDTLSLILLAQNRRGYGNLCELITLARTRPGADKGTYCLHPEDIDTPQIPLVHLATMPDCVAILVTRPQTDEAELTRQAAWIKNVFGERGWIGMTLLQRPYEDDYRYRVQHVAQSYCLPFVALGNVLMHVRSCKPLQDTLTAIRLGQPVSECGFSLSANAEQHLRSRLRQANLYPAEALDETVRIAKLCTFSLDELRYEYPDELVPAGETPASYLRSETWIGAHRRFPKGIPESVQKIVEHELSLIGEMQYEPYFLTVYDIVRFARDNHILCQGRGSAANSAVCYCLGITEVDPARGTMLFERFISRERNEPPDIDVDFEHQRREEVIQYIYRKYGRIRAALTGVVICYRRRSTIRDIGKALGVDPGMVELVAKSLHQWDGRESLADRLGACGMDADSPVVQKWADLAERLRNFPRHLSQHPGGFVIARDKLSRLVPIENAAMADRSVIQWDKDDIDAIGLLKIDVLALGMLSMIRRALNFISEMKGEPFELQDVPAECSVTYDMICKADTIGVFQMSTAI